MAHGFGRQNHGAVVFTEGVMGRLTDSMALVRMGLNELLGRPPKPSASSSLATFLETRSDPPRKKTDDFLKAYSESPWLRAVVHRVASGVGAVRWYLETKGGDKVEEHPFLTMLEEGNAQHTGATLLRVTQMHLDLTGDAYWIHDFNRAGIPVESWVVPPHWVDETPSTENGGVYIVSFPNSQRYEITPDNILRFTDPDPFDPYQRGSGTAKSLEDEIETDEYAAKHTKNWFFNRARPDLIIQANDYTAENVRRIERQWMGRHQGYWKAHLPAFLRGQDLSIKEISQTFEQMELVKLRQHERDMVMQVFGVSPEIFGVLESSNRATIEAADYLFSRWVLVPRLEFMREILQYRMIPLYDSNLVLKYESPIREDADRELQMKKTAAWTMTMNEWREEIGLEPIPDGDVYLIPLNMSLREDLSEMTVDELLANV